MASQNVTKATFQTTILEAGKNITGIRIPDDIIDNMGAGKKPPVTITMKGYTYLNTVAVMGGTYMVGVSAEHRAASKVKGGETVEVTIELDTEERVVEVPDDFQKALNKNVEAEKKFYMLSNSKKKVLTLPIANGKTAETRNKNIEKAMQVLLNSK
jgi:uncharacterized protein YdeI (YjbR/CyaY-like superfamily)